jgi:nucleotide-binding universal stress UspA family protein
MAYRKILHGLDGSEASFKALEHALELARRFHAELHTVLVEEVPRYPGTAGEILDAEQAGQGRYAEALRRANHMAGVQGVELQCHALVGHEVKTITEFIREQGFDLLVIGFVGHSALYDRVMGSTGQGLVRLAGCTVLVVKEQTTEEIIERTS